MSWLTVGNWASHHGRVSSVVNESQTAGQGEGWQLWLPHRRWKHPLGCDKASCRVFLEMPRKLRSVVDNQIVFSG
jgi:hypothetical protein